MSLYNALAYLFPAAVAGTDYLLRNDGDGDYIAEWNLAVTKPTDSEISAAEVVADSNESIKLQILLLEETVTERRIREAVLGTDDGWLKDLNAQVAALRAKLVTNTTTASNS